MNYSTPEEQGIRSEQILNYILRLEESRLSTHDIILARHGHIIYEAYWEPFHKDFLHRMYSVSKCFVSLAIGFLLQEGKLSLDDPISKYFPEELKNQPDKNMQNQTIRHMLMMATAKPPKKWFDDHPTDRVQQYFDNNRKESRPSGTIFQYDSSGSFVLGALVERLTGKKLLDYLRDCFLDEIGFSKEAYFLSCPGGHSWADAGLLCTANDLLLVAQFVLNEGCWNGKQLLNSSYIKEATKKQIDNSILNTEEWDTHGYGYQFWRTHDNSYLFNGLGCQFAICVPDKGLIFIYNGDNQGRPAAEKIIIDNFFDLIARPAKEHAVPDDEDSLLRLIRYSSKLSLTHVIGGISSPMIDEIQDKTYLLDENPMGMVKLRFRFHDNIGTLYYTNAQGDKELSFGFGENVYSRFPQDGYFDETGGIPGNRRYRQAASGAWVDTHTLLIKVQIIDNYLGNLHMKFSFNGSRIGIHMVKKAEAFLEEYEGFAGGMIAD